MSVILFALEHCIQRFYRGDGIPRPSLRFVQQEDDDRRRSRCCGAASVAAAAAAVAQH